jgi:hypothetical protein
MDPVEPFFQFLGGYWWLVFPLIGVMGGAGRALERASRRRHERRLEILRAKGEITAARHGEGAPRPLTQQGNTAVPSGTASAGGDPRTDAASRRERTMAAHDAVTARWLEYELDVAKTISYPAMSDGRQPLTAAFLRAKKVADRMRPASAGATTTPEQLADYENAVTDYEVAFDVAERDARRLKDSSFTAPERKRLDVAKQLLTVAVDEAATPAERQVAYRRVREELDGLISLSDGAVDVLERRVALELPAAPPREPDPPTA